MSRRLLIAAVIASLAIAASCKKRHAADEEEEPVADDTPAGPEPAAKTPAAPVDPDPYFQPTDTDTARPGVDAAPLPSAAISEGGAAVFTAADSSMASVTWTVDATDLSFSPVVVGSRPDSTDVQIVMESGGRKQMIATCRGLSKSNGGTVTAHTRGADVAFVACFTRSADVDDKGRSWGARIKWNKDKRIAELAGTWQNAGPPAFDTMDFEEGK